MGLWAGSVTVVSRVSSPMRTGCSPSASVKLATQQLKEGAMGDKGGKQDKEKDEKQHAGKQQQKEKEKQGKQPPKKVI